MRISIRTRAFVQIAHAQNIPLRVAGARVFEAWARLGIAIGGQYPQVQQAVGSALDIRESERAPTAPQRRSPADQFEYKQVQVAAAASWEIDFWGKFRRAVESEDASFLGSIAAYDNAFVSHTGEVARIYVAIRTIEERLRITKKNVGIQKESLRIAQARFGAGASTDRDVQKALAQLRGTEAVVFNIYSGMKFGPALPNNYVTGNYFFTAKSLYTKILRIAVSSVSC